MNRDDIRSYIHQEVDHLVEAFLVREEKEIKDLFAQVKEEEADRITQLLEGIKTHTARIVALENQMQVIIAEAT